MAETPNFDNAALAKLEGLDKHIEELFQCKPLPESEISKLCELVSVTLTWSIVLNTDTSSNFTRALKRKNGGVVCIETWSEQTLSL